MNVQLIKPVCNIHHDACPCREWEFTRIRNELIQAKARIQELEDGYSRMLKALEEQHAVEGL